MTTKIKDPQAVGQYKFDWSAFLAEFDDILSTSEVLVTPVGLEITDVNHDLYVTTYWLSAGEIGQTYRVINRVTTAGGLLEDRTQTFLIKQL